ncbi:MAG: desulfoferrodoxin [Clostridia bacterium]|nr:desulfoferrodoxin [Clostridia bacterium]
MNKELKIKKCFKCGAVIKVIDDCNCTCGFQCCGEEMKTLVPNSVDAAVEKHVPTYEIKDGKIFARVNHVMEENHYIEWISIVFDGEEKTTYFKPGDEPVAHCKYVPGSIIYAYCNTHGLWKKEVD